MGIRLDWEIEAEQEHYQQSGGEDPDAKRKRRRARARFLVVLFIMLALVGAGVGVVALRIRQVQLDTEQVVRDSVTAEVAALRLGDRNAFMDMQRSASDDWLQQQGAVFDRYQALKQTEDVNLTGQVLNVQVDDARARVEVEEIIGGVPYGRIWFYWHYADGWRHVPPDYTFWGDSRTVTADNALVNYRAVDEPVAQAAALMLANWLKQGCAALGCGSLPHLTLDILPAPTQQIAWSASDSWTLQMPSPFVNSARLDTPFDLGTQIKVANLVADHLLSSFSPTYPTDAYYLRQGIVSWLVKQFAQVETNSFLISSLAQNYGDTSVGRLLQAMQPTSNISIITSITGTTLDGANLDWRDFLTWRLALENELITRGDQADFMLLYDPGAQDQASARYAAGASSDTRTVISAIPEQGSGGTPQLHAVVQVGSPATSQEDVIFRLVDGVWKRSS